MSIQTDCVPWWRQAVLYQIYPRSFNDSGRKGWGDLLGILNKIKYISSLGVDAIWISPFFKSPMRDFGYDVENHRQVDPMFGTDADFDALIEEAHHHGVKVMIDLVLSHVSDQHPWFVEACRGRGSRYDEHFIWADPQPDGTPPNNWLSVFGGRAWSWQTTRKQYYLHNFLSTQPDLNFHSKKVRQNALDITRFWLKRGVDGFRLDTVNFYFHDQKLRDNPPATLPDTLSAPDVNPYGYQDHIYDKNRPEVSTFLGELSELMRQFPDTITLGEVGATPERSLKLVNEYTHPNRLNLCYSFDLLGGVLTAEYIRSVIRRSQSSQNVAQSDEGQNDGRHNEKTPNDRSQNDEGDLWACWSFSNHDVARAASRLAPAGVSQDHIARLLLGLVLSLRGTPCIYQGEELGLPEVEIEYHQLQDPYGVEFWPDFKGRDGCRTPMPWDKDSLNCGFTHNDVEPWLPIPETHRDKAVSEQDVAETSVLNFFRMLIKLRKKETTLLRGNLRILSDSKELLQFSRDGFGRDGFGRDGFGRDDGSRMLQCHFNLSDQVQHISPESFDSEPLSPEVVVHREIDLIAGHQAKWSREERRIELMPWGWAWCLVLSELNQP